MSVNPNVLLSDCRSTGYEKELNLDNIPHLHQLTDYFSPQSLPAEERIRLGIKVLEKYGEASFSYYQGVFRLTLDEHNLIFERANHYEKDLAIWEILDEDSCREEVELIKSLYPDAKFSQLWTKEENHRTHCIVEIDGKRYYFYSKAFKGPIVDESYIAQYALCQPQESRPDFKVLTSPEKTVFLMEFVSVETPNFRNEAHLALLIGLISQFSLNKKGLDMLPCRLALEEEKIYCVDQKPNYGTYSTEIDAFKENIKALKSKIAYRGYAEEGSLLSFVDKIARSCEIQIFEKTLENLSFIHAIGQLLPPSSLHSEQKVNLVAAILRKYGTRRLAYAASVYSLSRGDQKESIRLAGDGLIKNTTVWSEEIPSCFTQMHEKAKKVFEEHGLKAQFTTYLNYVGNYKDVLTVTLDGEIFVIREVDENYIHQYQHQMEKEHRPDYRTFSLEKNSFLFLSKFMGPQTVQYENEHHLDRVIDLAFHFSENEKSTIDFNPGNLVIEGGKLFYIDKDLSYASSTHPRLTNLKGIFQSIDEYFHTEHERVRCKTDVKNKIRPLFNPDDSKDREILETFFLNEFKPKSFDEFLGSIDMDKREDRDRLVEKLPQFFQTMDDFRAMKGRLIFIANKILESSFVKAGGSGYYENVEKRTLKLLEAFRASFT
jgi:hypothetical protein